MGCWECGVYKVHHNINKVWAEVWTYGATGAALQWHDSNLCHPARESHLPDDQWLANTAAWRQRWTGEMCVFIIVKPQGQRKEARECARAALWKATRVRQVDILYTYMIFTPFTLMYTYSGELSSLLELLWKQSNGFNMPLSLLRTTTMGLMSPGTRGLVSSCSGAAKPKKNWFDFL